MTDDTDNCGWPTANDTACLNPATEDDGRCWIPSHGNPDADNPGRPKAFDEEWRRKALYNAVRTGATHVHHQAGIAGVDRSTLNRSLCCVNSPSDPALTVSPDDACDFCNGYVRAHSEGAVGTLENCKPEFVASAAYGYRKTEGREHSGPGGGPIRTEDVSDEEREVLLDAFDEEPET